MQIRLINQCDLKTRILQCCKDELRNYFVFLRICAVSDHLSPGMQSRTFECQRCGQSLIEVAKSDVYPIATAAGWVRFGSF